MNSETPDSTEGLSIGALSRATGISIHSLRMWERRYGAPASMRRTSGHRRYPFEEVARLRAVARALAAGLRASQVVNSTIEEIDNLVDQRVSSGKGRRRSQATMESNQTINDKIGIWVEACIQFDEPRLSEEFRRDWEEIGHLRFLHDRVIPFIKRLGELWQCGEMGIAQEHFATERLCDFIAGQWRFRNSRLTGRPYVLATLPKDVHRIGLHMAAMVTVMSGQRVIFLGPEVPVEDIVRASKISHASAVCLSISVSTASRFSNRALSSLSEMLPQGVDLVCGGSGAPPKHDHALIFRTLIDYDRWLHRVRSQTTNGHH